MLDRISEPIETVSAAEGISSHASGQQFLYSKSG
jgi:hypothetical protein